MTRRRRIGAGLRALCAVALATAGPAAGLALAQASDEIDVTLEVLPSLTVDGVAPLRFGAVTGGDEQRVAPTDAGRAGRWRLDGIPNEAVTVELSLPAAVTASEGQQVPLDFAGPTAAWSVNPDGTGAVPFDPRQPLALTVPENGTVYIFLGGRCRVPKGQPPGSYAAKATLTASYVEP